MDRWYRIFSGNDAQPAPAAILEHLQGFAAGARGDFVGDGAGWYAAVIHAGGAALEVERYLVTEEGIRAELNNWAAWLETCEQNPNHRPLMERVIQARQLFTVRRPTGAGEAIAEGLCRFLAAATEGVWQADERGFLAADGTLLLADRGEGP